MTSADVSPEFALIKSLVSHLPPHDTLNFIDIDHSTNTVVIAYTSADVTYILPARITSFPRSVTAEDDD